jgi:hydroxyacid-oxoacid transhydrogenase
MSCCHYQPTGDGLDTAFTVDASRITFGRGCPEELGDRAQALGMTRVALFSDAVVARLSVFDTAQRSLRTAGIDVIPCGVRVTGRSRRLCLRRRRLGD